MDRIRTFGLLGLSAAALLASVVVTTGDSAPYAIIPQLTALITLCAAVVSWDALWGIAASASAAFAMNVYLLLLKVDASTGKAACTINEVFDCGLVNKSAASMVGPVPVTLLGASFAAGLVLASITAPQGKDRTATIFRLTAAMAIPALLFSVWLGWQSKLLGVWCLVCIALYATHAVLLWAGLKGLREVGAPFAEALDGAFLSKEGMAFMFAFWAGLLGGFGWYKDAIKLPSAPAKVADKNDTPADPMAEIKALYARPAGPVATTGGEPLLGKPDARIQIVEWADFGCPHCAEAEKEIAALIEANPDVNLRYRYFPLSGACNPLLEDPREGRPPPDPARCHAAYAAECAHKQGKFWEMAHLLFTNQRSEEAFKADGLRTMATQIGLDLPKWEACMSDPATAKWIAESARAGETAGVQGTPALFVKGLSNETILMTRQVRGLEALIDIVSSGTSLPPAEPAKD